MSSSTMQNLKGRKEFSLSAKRKKELLQRKASRQSAEEKRRDEEEDDVTDPQRRRGQEPKGTMRSKSLPAHKYLKPAQKGHDSVSFRDQLKAFFMWPRLWSKHRNKVPGSQAPSNIATEDAWRDAVASGKIFRFIEAQAAEMLAQQQYERSKLSLPPAGKHNKIPAVGDECENENNSLISTGGDGQQDETSLRYSTASQKVVASARSSAVVAAKDEGEVDDFGRGAVRRRLIFGQTSSSASSGSSNNFAGTGNSRSLKREKSISTEEDAIANAVPYDRIDASSAGSSAVNVVMNKAAENTSRRATINEDNGQQEDDYYDSLTSRTEDYEAVESEAGRSFPDSEVAEIAALAALPSYTRTAVGQPLNKRGLNIQSVGASHLDRYDESVTLRLQSASSTSSSGGAPDHGQEDDQRRPSQRGRATTTSISGRDLHFETPLQEIVRGRESSSKDTGTTRSTGSSVSVVPPTSGLRALRLYSEEFGEENFALEQEHVEFSSSMNARDTVYAESEDTVLGGRNTKTLDSEVAKVFPGTPGGRLSSAAYQLAQDEQDNQEDESVVGNTGDSCIREEAERRLSSPSSNPVLPSSSAHSSSSSDCDVVPDDRRSVIGNASVPGGGMLENYDLRSHILRGQSAEDTASSGASSVDVGSDRAVLADSTTDFISLSSSSGFGGITSAGCSCSPSSAAAEDAEDGLIPTEEDPVRNMEQLHVDGRGQDEYPVAGQRLYHTSLICSAIDEPGEWAAFQLGRWTEVRTPADAEDVFRKENVDAAFSAERKIESSPLPDESEAISFGKMAGSRNKPRAIVAPGGGASERENDFYNYVIDKKITAARGSMILPGGSGGFTKTGTGERQLLDEFGNRARGSLFHLASSTTNASCSQQQLGREHQCAADIQPAPETSMKSVLRGHSSVILEDTQELQSNKTTTKADQQTSKLKLSFMSSLRTGTQSTIASQGSREFPSATSSPGNSSTVTPGGYAELSADMTSGGGTPWVSVSEEVAAGLTSVDLMRNSRLNGGVDRGSRSTNASTPAQGPYKNDNGGASGGRPITTTGSVTPKINSFDMLSSMPNQRSNTSNYKASRNSFSYDHSSTQHQFEQGPLMLLVNQQHVGSNSSPAVFSSRPMTRGNFRQHLSRSNSASSSSALLSLSSENKKNNSAAALPATATPKLCAVPELSGMKMNILEQTSSSATTFSSREHSTLFLPEDHDYIDNDQHRTSLRQGPQSQSTRKNSLLYSHKFDFLNTTSSSWLSSSRPESRTHQRFREHRHFSSTGLRTGSLLERTHRRILVSRGSMRAKSVDSSGNMQQADEGEQDRDLDDHVEVGGDNNNAAVFVDFSTMAYLQLQQNDKINNNYNEETTTMLKTRTHSKNTRKTSPAKRIRPPSLPADLTEQQRVNARRGGILKLMRLRSSRGWRPELWE
ncbi:unnamed protein product [Amoebophrya sp. A25]|nr:unnamed protein product [Amoebophrya sp. A25]|eukprot:GSA25T00010551001.1